MQWIRALANDFKYGFFKDISGMNILLASMMAGLLLITLFSLKIAGWFKKDHDGAQSLSLWIKSAALVLTVIAAILITQ